MTDEEAIDRILTKAVRDGDTSAWTVLYDRHFGGVLRAAERLCPKDRALAEDVVQEAWMIAVKKIETFDADRGRFSAWLAGIVEKVAANARRRSRSFPETFGTEAAGVEARSRTDPAHDVDLATAMHELPDRYRRVLEAKYADRLSVAEIALRFCDSEKAIESLLTRARAALKKSIDEATKSER